MGAHRSRILRRQERQSKKSIIFAILGTIIVVFAIFKVGIPLLAQFSLFLTNLTHPQETAGNTGPGFVQAPILDPVPIATNSGTIKLTGVAISEREIQIFISGDLVDKVNSDKDGHFEVPNLKIRSGQNTISAKTKDGDNLSDSSNSLSVAFDDEAPSLEVTNPTDNQSFSKFDSKIEVRGKTEKEARVTVNDFRAVVDSLGNFSYLLELSGGENNISIKAIDPAGNETEVKRKVTYSP